MMLSANKRIIDQIMQVTSCYEDGAIYLFMFLLAQHLDAQTSSIFNRVHFLVRQTLAESA